MTIIKHTLQKNRTNFNKAIGIQIVKSQAKLDLHIQKLNDINKGLNNSKHHMIYFQKLSEKILVIQGNPCDYNKHLSIAMTITNKRTTIRNKNRMIILLKIGNK